MNIKLTKFAHKHFDKSNKGTTISNLTIDEFESYISIPQSIVDIVDSNYAEFCKYLIIDNETDAKSGTVKISDIHESQIKSKYSARTKSELPVLTRWVELDKSDIPNANKLTLVLYSKEQLEFEHLEVYNELDSFEFLDMDVDYGIVAILAHNGENTDPIPPITMMRNHLGAKFGGSSVKIDEIEYRNSVEFWDKNINVRVK